LRTSGDPILYINNPPGVPSSVRRRTLDDLRRLNEITYQQIGDPQTHTRIQQYELAFRMQSSVPELTDLAQESVAMYQWYVDEARHRGTYATAVRRARRVVERGGSYVPVYHNHWVTHANVAGRSPDQCRVVDQAC